MDSWAVAIFLVFASAFVMSQACPKGLYGEDCKQKCSPKCIPRTCDNETGACDGNCKDGWMLPLCDTQCPDGTYGASCSRNCSENCVNGTCHPNNGTCHNGCKPGYYGHRCLNMCTKGLYGQGCLLHCSTNCKGGECHPTTGHCVKGCKEDFWGSDCSLFGNFKEAPVETQEKFYHHLSAESKSVLLYVLMLEYENTLDRAQEEISRGVRQRNELRRLIG